MGSGASDAWMRIRSRGCVVFVDVEVLLRCEGRGVGKEMVVMKGEGSG